MGRKLLNDFSTYLLFSQRMLKMASDRARACSWKFSRSYPLSASHVDTITLLAKCKEQFSFIFDISYWLLVRVTLVVAFGFLPKKFERWWGPMNHSFVILWMQVQLWVVVRRIKPYHMLKNLFGCWDTKTNMSIDLSPKWYFVMFTLKYALYLYFLNAV